MTQEPNAPNHSIASTDFQPAVPPSKRYRLHRRMQEEQEAQFNEISRPLWETKLRLWLHNSGVQCSTRVYDAMAKPSEEMQGNLQELIERNREGPWEFFRAYGQKVR